MGFLEKGRHTMHEWPYYEMEAKTDQKKGKKKATKFKNSSLLPEFLWYELHGQLMLSHIKPVLAAMPL